MNLHNLKMIELKQKPDGYALSVPLEKAFLDKWNTYEFVLSQPDALKRISLPYKVVRETQEHVIFELDIPDSELDECDGEDVVMPKLAVTGEDRNRMMAIKSSDDYIELLQERLADGIIRRPLTTKGGNVGFKIEEERLFARIDHAEFNANNELELYGLYYLNDISSDDIKNLEVVVKDRKTKQEYIFPAEMMGLPDIYRDRQWAASAMDKGFSTKIGLKTFVSTARSTTFALYLRLSLSGLDVPIVLESRRMTVNLNNLQRKPVQRLCDYANELFLISCEPTKQRRYLSVHARYYRPLRKYARKGYRKVSRIARSKEAQKLYRLIFGVMAKVNPVNRNLIIFESFHGKQYSDNPRAIYEYIDNSKRQYKLVWSADRRHLDKFKAAGVPHVKRLSFKWLYLMTSAGHWVTNARLPLWIPKPKHTNYVQTWHGTPLKRLAADMEEVHMPGTDTERYKRNFTSEAAKWDYLISPNAYSSEIFRRAFQFDKEMLETGYPRNDYLHEANNDWTIRRIKRRIGVDEEKKVILYAPTWRDNQFYKKGAYKFKLEMDLDALQQAFGETHVIVLRMHYLIAENLDIGAYEGFVYDCSAYEDIRDLYLAADVLITDYSSVFFDYANLRRPMMFFVYDIEEYRDNLRGFYFDFEEKAPGPLVRTTEEMIHELTKLEEEGFQPDANYNEFIEKFCYLEDGRASERVVQRVFDREQ